MIRGYGKRGNFNDALRMSERMASEGFQLTQDTMSGLLDAQLLINDLDGCMRLVDTMQKSQFRLNLLRTRKLIHALCLARRVDDAFLIFDMAFKNRVEGDISIYNDLIDLSANCHCPHRVLPVFKSLEERGIRPDFARSKTLVFLLSQNDCYKEALTVLNRIPMGSQRANMDAYMEMISACFRANTGEEAMRLVKEYLIITSAKHRPLHFFHFVLQGFRYLKDWASAGVIYDLILKEEGIEPDYDTYREYISCLLEGRKFKLAIEVYETMVKHGFEIQRDLVNVYVTYFSVSVNGDYHDRAWDMYIKGESCTSATGQIAYITMGKAWPARIQESEL
jgi:pentatricopeptide repeat protein